MLKQGSLNREFDYVRLDGLALATGRPPHEWDIYIIKELLDNALDADDSLWRATGKAPAIAIEIEYVRFPEHRSSQFHVQVSNQSRFPAEQIRDIFDPRWYTSKKTFVKGLSRGALGNALKTVLGIPYALRDRGVGDWRPDVRPMIVQVGSAQYLPAFVVNSITQTIDIECEEKSGDPVEGTLIKVGMDHFYQESPRTLHEIIKLAERYRLCNPQVKLKWTVEMDQQKWEQEYSPDDSWSGKFLDPAPVQWYSRSAFKDLLSALYREHCGENARCRLPVALVSREFQSPDDKADVGTKLPSLEQSLNLSELGPQELQDNIVVRLHQLLCKQSPAFESAKLGAIGKTHLTTTLNQLLPIEDEVSYQRCTDDRRDAAIPFVIEGALAGLRAGTRQLITATNFTPSYEDLFQNAQLQPRIKPAEKVRGLRELLDAYDLNEDVPVVLFLHLICPSLERYEFSKTEINHLPFSTAVAELIDQLVSQYRARQEEQERRIEEAITRSLQLVIEEIHEGERFVFDQLIEKLRARLSLDPFLAGWLEKPDSMSRLQTQVNNYQSSSAILSHRVARPAAGSLSLPLHPGGHFSVSIGQVSRDFLARHHVNKLLYLQVRELEPVVIDNNWLCTMDTALLCNPLENDDLQDAVLKCVVNSDLPLIVAHDADERGQSVVSKMRARLAAQSVDTRRVIDAGLSNAVANEQPSRLVEMMPNELAEWLRTRFRQLRVPIKYAPDDARVRTDIAERFKTMLLGHIWENVSRYLQLPGLMEQLDQKFNYTAAMRDRVLDQKLKGRLETEMSAESYATILERVVAEFFAEFMSANGDSFQASVKGHLEQVKNG
jgi:hypothetical protein